MKKILFIFIPLIALAGIAAWFIVNNLTIEEPVVCTQDAKLCEDGSYVGRVPPSCEFAECPAIALLQYNSNTFGVSLRYPVSWQRAEEDSYKGGDGFFIISAAGGRSLREIVESEAFHRLEPYGSSPQIEKTAFENRDAYYIFPSDDQPGGMNRQAAFYASYQKPVTIEGTVYQYFVIWADKDHIRGIADSAKLLEEKTIKLFYYNQDKDQDESGNIMCSKKGLAPVERAIFSENIIEDSIRLLIKGELTAQERQQGISTEYPLDGFKLVGSKLEDGFLALTFEDSSGRSNGGSCRVGILWFQIEATAKQFPEVEQVYFLPADGLFQP